MFWQKRIHGKPEIFFTPYVDCLGHDIGFERVQIQNVE